MKRLMLFILLPFLSGCIVRDIRDEMRAANQHLAEAQPVLIETRGRLQRVNEDMARTNALLADLHGTIAQTNDLVTEVHGTIARTNTEMVEIQDMLGETQPSLDSVDSGLERMRIEEVLVSLAQVNTALAPLTKSMGALGGAMSFLGIGGGDDILAQEEVPAAPEGAPAEATEVASDSGSSRRLDPLVGTWVMVYPSPAAGNGAGKVFVLSSEGSYLLAEEGSPLRTGRWVRDGRTLKVEPDAPSAGDPPETLELITLTARTLTVRNGDELRVFTRP